MSEHPGTWIEEHDCASCVECIHDGHKCCGCYDGACCHQPSERQENR